MGSAKRRGREFWTKQAKAWKASGLSCTEFAEKLGVKPRTLSWWAWKLGTEASTAKLAKRKPAKPRKNRAAAKRQVEPLEFIEVVAARADDRIEIEIGDAVVRVPRDVDATQLARVLEVLAAR